MKQNVGFFFLFIANLKNFHLYEILLKKVAGFHIDD